MTVDANIEQSLESVEEISNIEPPLESASVAPCLYVREDGVPDKPLYGSVSTFYNGEIPSYNPDIENLVLQNDNLIVESRFNSVLAAKQEELKAAFKEMIYSNYSSEKQKNIDREALALKAIQSIDASRLTEAEREKLARHDEMNAWINEKREEYRTTKESLQSMSIEELLNFDCCL